VFFTGRPEGEPGMYIERIPPYAGTLNPGFDPVLPEYKPLAMFDAMRDALTFDEKFNKKWERTNATRPEPPVYETRYAARFAGDESGAAYAALRAAGLAFGESGNRYIIDVGGCMENGAGVKKILNDITQCGGLAFIITDGAAAAAKVGAWLGIKLTWHENDATMLLRGGPHPFTDSLSLPDMYTVESGAQKYILYGAFGLPETAEILLKPAPTDWSLFNNRPENIKCGAVFMREAVEKNNARDWAGLAVIRVGEGTVVLSSVRMEQYSNEHLSLMRKLLFNMGFLLNDTRGADGENRKKAHDLLLNGPV
jgi:beta-galactosidase